MIRHVVLFSFKPDLDPADREWIIGQVQGIRRIPSVRNFAFGRLLEPAEEWYKPRMCTDYDLCVTLEFDDEAGLYAYQNDPYHVVVAQEVRKRVTAIKVSDFVTF